MRDFWTRAAQLGQAQWLFGNVYEAVVDVPRLLATRPPSPNPLSPGSPVRYWAPTAPLTFAATGVTLVRSWRSGGDRRAVVAAAAGTGAAVALTAYLVRTVNLPLLRDADADAARLAKTWHRGNLARLAALAVSSLALRKLAEANGS